MALVNHLDVLRNDIAIFDALNLAQGPVGVVHLPMQLRLGLHGNFVEQSEIDAWAKRRAEGGDLGPAKAAEEPLPWQVKLKAEEANGQKEEKAVSNGTNGTNTSPL